MDTVKEIEESIKQLTPGERVRLERWFYTQMFPLDEIAEEQEAENRVEELAVQYEPASERRLMTVDEYLTLEASSPRRHEFVAGHVFAMTGVSKAHNVIGLNVATSMKSHLRGRPCDVFMSDFKLKFSVASDDLVYYPDVMVACDRGKRDACHTSQPRLIVEVLSPSTRNNDLRDKFVNYRQLASVEEYVVVEQQRPELTIYRRGVRWRKDLICGMDAVAEFRSIELSMPLTRIFEGVADY